MTDASPPDARPLPRGRHGLSREQVAASQRERLLRATAVAMARTGYAATPISAILAEAGVSRQTFYELFDSKEACFVATFDAAARMALRGMRAAADPALPPRRRARAAIGAYVDAVTAAPEQARVLLLDVHAAGPEAMARRAALQEGFTDLVVELSGLGDDERHRFACAMVVAGTGAIVTTHLAAGDLDALPGLRADLERLVADVLPEDD